MGKGATCVVWVGGGHINTTLRAYCVDHRMLHTLSTPRMTKLLSLGRFSDEQFNEEEIAVILTGEIGVSHLIQYVVQCFSLPDQDFNALKEASWYVYNILSNLGISSRMVIRKRRFWISS